MKRLAILVLVAACAHKTPPVGELRFKVADPVWRVNDRVPLVKEPKEREYNRTLYHADGFVFRRTTRAMEMRPATRAQDVNALDEVPDSTWFTNRIGVRDLSIEELRRGPNVTASPFDHRPWSITGAKIGGMSIGFTFEDARGDKYLLKFDKADSPEMETGAHAIVLRILWAIGYNVPEDHIGYIRAEDLVVGDKAKKKGLTPDELALALSRVHRTNDGRIRVLASRFLPGKPIGPYAREGTRGDDKNDVIPHENRRSLRGQRPIFSWLNHTDLQEDNTLDAFTEDNFVVHYLIDFGKALGTMGYHLKWQTPGHTYRMDLGMAFEQLLTLGLRKRNWDGLDDPGLRGIGVIDAKHYSPGEWRPNSMYWPLEDADRHDGFWGAKLLMRFTPQQLAAIVEEAQYSDPRAAKYMLDTLIERQRKTAAYWFDRVAPLDAFAVDSDVGGARVCFTDLMLAYQLRAPRTLYKVDAFDAGGKRIADARTLGAMPGGRTCVNGVALADYTIVRLRVSRGDRDMPPVLVHVARDANGPRIIGLRRR
jgi:hypothetical protein